MTLVFPCSAFKGSTCDSWQVKLGRGSIVQVPLGYQGRTEAYGVTWNWEVVESPRGTPLFKVTDGQHPWKQLEWDPAQSSANDFINVQMRAYMGVDSQIRTQYSAPGFFGWHNMVISYLNERCAATAAPPSLKDMEEYMRDLKFWNVLKEWDDNGTMSAMHGMPFFSLSHHSCTFVDQSHL